MCDDDTRLEQDAPISASNVRHALTVDPQTEPEVARPGSRSRQSGLTSQQVQLFTL